MKNKVAFIFTGQGTQFVGMGKDFYDTYPICKQVYQMASQVTGIDIEAICFEENEKLHRTQYTQIAVLATEMAMYQVLSQLNITADVVAGLSLGEYSALVAAGVLSMEDAFYLVRKRGIIMEEAYPEGGAMAAIIGLDSDMIEKVCNQEEGIVSIANYNCPGQYVISGEQKAVDKSCEVLMGLGAIKCTPLKVSGPFHSPLLKEAGDRLMQELLSVSVNNPTIPYVDNVTGKYETESSKIKELMVKQVYSSVKWQQSVEAMLNEGVEIFVEIGPGRTLTSFLRRIDSKVKKYNVQRITDLERLAENIYT